MKQIHSFFYIIIAVFSALNWDTFVVLFLKIGRRKHKNGQGEISKDDYVFGEWPLIDFCKFDQYGSNGMKVSIYKVSKLKKAISKYDGSKFLKVIYNFTIYTR